MSKRLLYCTLVLSSVVICFAVAVVTRRVVATGTRLPQTLSSSTGNVPTYIIRRLGAQRMLGVSLPQKK